MNFWWIRSRERVGNWASEKKIEDVIFSYKIDLLRFRCGECQLIFSSQKNMPLIYRSISMHRAAIKYSRNLCLQWNEWMFHCNTRRECCRKTVGFVANSCVAFIQVEMELRWKLFEMIFHSDLAVSNWFREILESPWWSSSSSNHRRRDHHAAADRTICVADFIHTISKRDAIYAVVHNCIARRRHNAESRCHDTNAFTALTTTILTL